jgi:cytochrome c553
MRCGWSFSLFILVLTGVAQAQTNPPSEEGAKFFETKIRPVLVQHCYACHSDTAEKEKKLKGGLRLDTREAMRRGGETGPAVVPGDVSKSLVVAALRHESLAMPPNGKLAEAVVVDFVKWIELGAPDPREGIALRAPSAIDIEATRRSHWAFRPPQKATPPTVKQLDWPRGDIDRFVLAKLESAGLRPAGPAEKRDWLRRVYFGLIGLPATPQEVDAFLADQSANPQAAVVDRLLDSPHYGERWARHWLDVARYAEDQALANARDNPHAFRYRDWVVAALNSDMPYDRFLRLQLAGDLLTEPVDDYFQRLAGLGFQGLGQLYHRGNFPEQVMADELDDRIDTISRGLLGLTVACARCHDHKYDPIPTADYYSLAAAYQGSNLVELPLASPTVVEQHKAFVDQTKQREEGLAAWLKQQGMQLSRQRLADLRRYLVEAWRIQVRRVQKQPIDEKLIAEQQGLTTYFLSRWEKLLETADLGKAREPLHAWHKAAREAAKKFSGDATTAEFPAELAQITDDLCAKAAALDAELGKLDAAYEQARSAAKSNDEQVKVARGELSDEWKRWSQALLTDGAAPLAIGGGDIIGQLDAAARQLHDQRRAEIDAFKKTGPTAPLLVHGVKGGGTPLRIHVRGNVENKGEAAPPGFLQILRAEPAIAANEDQAASRSQASVFTRLELAQAIASRDNPLTARVIVNRVWHYHFGQGIVATPSNFGLVGAPPSHSELLDYLAVSFIEHGWSLKWLHRQIVLSQTYRLSSANEPANAIRDPENRLLWRWTPRRLDFEASRDAVLSVSGRLDSALGGPSQPVDASVRRTIYAKISRSRLDPTLAIFDFPDANASNERRSVTTVAQQQLFVLNSPFMIESAKALAARASRGGDDDTVRITAAYRLAYGREPTAAEQSLGRDFLMTAVQADEEKLKPWERYAHALLAANEFTWLP